MARPKGHPQANGCRYLQQQAERPLKTDGKQRFEDADFLRGVAAAGVVVYHFLYGFLPAAPSGGFGASLVSVDRPVLLAAFNGPFLVSVFFVLSSFVLTSNLVRQSDPRRAAIGVIKRFPRLLPLTIIGTALPAALFFCGWMFNSEAAGLTGSSWLERSGGVKLWEPWPYPTLPGAALDVLSLFVRGISQYNSVLWTMKYELLGSILALITAALLGSRPRALLDGAIAALLAYAALKVHPLCAVCVATVYLTKYGFPLLRRLGKSWGLALILVGLVLGSTNQSFPQAWLADEWAARQILRADWFIHGLGAMLLLMGTRAMSLSSVYQSAPSRFLARHSFAMYVLHVPLQGSVASLVILLLGNNVLGIAMAFVVSTGLLALLMRPVSRLDEVWVNRLNRVFSRSKTLRGKNAAGVEPRPASAPAEEVSSGGLGWRRAMPWAFETKRHDRL
jgi:peptidoglycan/LPS O-acetylase OafA/YrhL